MIKHAKVVTSEEEDTLWASKVIGDHDPIALQRAVFYVGKTFCLRGGEEQHSLKRSQFISSRNPDSYTYGKMVPKITLGLVQRSIIRLSLYMPNSRLVLDAWCIY